MRKLTLTTLKGSGKLSSLRKTSNTASGESYNTCECLRKLTTKTADDLRGHSSKSCTAPAPLPPLAWSPFMQRWAEVCLGFSFNFFYASAAAFYTIVTVGCRLFSSSAPIQRARDLLWVSANFACIRRFIRAVTASAAAKF